MSTIKRNGDVFIILCVGGVIALLTYCVIWGLSLIGATRAIAIFVGLLVWAVYALAIMLTRSVSKRR